MSHTVDLRDKKFPSNKRSLRRDNLKYFIESFTGIQKYTSPMAKCDAVRDILCWIIETCGDDRDGYTYAHQYVCGPRLRRFTVWKFPLDAQPDRLSVRTAKKQVAEDSGWFGVEPEDEMTWLRVLESILIEVAIRLLSPEEIHWRLGGAVKEKAVEPDTTPN